MMIKEDTSKMRLLLVEDEPDLVTGLVRALRTEGYAVDTAADGEEGLHKALSNTYSVIVLDVMLPGRDGWSLLSELRKKKQTPVLLLTARDTSRERVHGFDLGADDYMTKPFDLPELLARLRALIRRSTGPAQTVVQIGDVVLDTKARSVSRNGTEIPLTAREYGMLEYLASHRGEVVSRTALYEQVFDENDDSLSNVIDVHIFNLRKKLGTGIITTRRGHGYCVP